MATVLRRRRIVNPGIRTSARRRKKRNVGEIVTIGLAGLNPGRRKRKHRITRHRKSNSMAILTFGTKGKKRTKNMAKRRRRANTTTKRRHTRRRVNSGVRRRRRVNTSHRRRTVRRTTRRVNSGVRRYSRRRRNSGIMVRRRRRNSGYLSSATGGITQGLQIVGGAILCNMLSGYLPASLSGGFMGYAATAAVAMAQGAIASKVLKNPTLGKNLQLGGFVILALKIVKDLMPSLGNPFAGMGILAPTSFYNPQVPIPNSMTQFQVPSAVMSALPAPQSNSMGRVMRTARVGRM